MIRTKALMKHGVKTFKKSMYEFVAALASVAYALKSASRPGVRYRSSAAVRKAFSADASSLATEYGTVPNSLVPLIPAVSN